MISVITRLSEDINADIESCYLIVKYVTITLTKINQQ